MKKFITLFFITTLFFGMTGLVTLYGQDEEGSGFLYKGMSFDNFMQTEEFQEGVRRFMELFDHELEFAVNYLRSQISIDSFDDAFGVAIDDSGRLVMPRYIEGQYINSDGIFVIQIMPGAERKDAVIEMLTGVVDLNHVLLEVVEFSNRELSDIADFLGAHMQAGLESNSELAFNALSFNCKYNRVEVWLHDYSEHGIAMFRRTILDSPAVIFREAVEFVHLVLILPEEDDCLDPASLPIDFMPIAPGAGIQHGRYAGSVGFRVRHRFTGEVGFITAAHVIPRGVYVRRPNVIQPLGWSHSVFWQLSGSVDATFVWTAASPLNWIPGGAHANVIGIPRMGSPVAKVGATTGFTTGVIERVNLSSGGLSDLVLTNVWAGSGDSGGIVYFTGGLDVNRPAGVATSVIPQMTDAQERVFGPMIFTSAFNIIAAFNLQLEVF